MPARWLLRLAFQWLSGRDHPTRFSVRDAGELRRTLSLIDCEVPPLHVAQRRHQAHREWAVLRGYLLALAGAGLLVYPLSVTRGESPDFVLTDAAGRTTGLEVTAATREAVVRRLKDPAQTALGPGPDGTDGWQGDGAEQDWVAAVLRAVDKKRSRLARGLRSASWQAADRQELIVYDWVMIPGLDWGQAGARLREALRTQASADAPGFDALSLLREDRLVYDLGGAWREVYHHGE